MTIAKPGPVTAKQQAIRDAFMVGELDYASAIQRFESEAGHQPGDLPSEKVALQGQNTWKARRRNLIVQMVERRPDIHVSDIVSAFKDRKADIEADLRILKKHGRIHTLRMGHYHPGPKPVAVA